MADYPAYNQVYGSAGNYKEPLEIDYCQSGQVNGRDMFDGDKREFDIRHVGISQANVNTILALYGTKAGNSSFTFDSTETGATHTVLFGERPEVSHIGADKHNVRVLLVEV